LGFGSDQWVLPASARNETVAMLYTYCFYWSTLLLSTIGDVPLPVERSEYVFVLFDYMIGMFSIHSNEIRFKILNRYSHICNNYR
jgi:hypothetical protein